MSDSGAVDRVPVDGYRQLDAECNPLRDPFGVDVRVLVGDA